MFRAFEVILMALILSASAYTFHIKGQSEDRLAEIKRLQSEIRDHKDTIDLLEADWSLLNQPSRVQKLIQAFQEQLQLQTTEAQQIVTASELPRFRPEPEVDAIADAIMTGSVE
ncbi:MULTISPECIES: cell division protein FtsL [unclassified Lentilitoribacter]|jgi:hypothetical protein|uniref:cell division protein FtsL n=1 Tax=unclassified Lentilitoribacter TaxID=2647570 RepID=UPI0013A703E3|nr:hypothetical protein [Lentilitoribacter sp. Alg239-R112]